MRRALTGLAAITIISGGLDVAPALPLAAADAADAAAAAAWPGLRGIKRVGIEVIFTPDHPQLAPEVVEKRLEDALLGSPNAPTPDPRSLDRLRLVVAVREVSGNDLRGFYLPMSGTYGLGSVRLTVERQVVVVGERGSAAGARIPALVWQVERQARAPWRRSGAEIMGLVDDLVASFVEDLRGDGG
jgi:hypothetical protein